MQDNMRYDIEGMSMQDGIIFRSSILPLEVETIYQKKPEVRLRNPLELFFGFIPARYVRDLKFVSWKFVLAIDIPMIILSLFTKNISVIFAVIYMALFVSKDLFNLVYLVFQIKLGKGKRIGRYHAAEHMAIGAYEKYKRVPTLAEIRTVSRFQENCGSRIIFKRIGLFLPLSLIFLSASFVDIKVYIVECVIMVIIAILTSRKSTVKYLQILVTNKPTDKELQVAIKGIKALQEAEDDFEEKMDGFIGGCFIII